MSAKHYFLCIIVFLFVSNAPAQNNRLPGELLSLVEQSLTNYPRIGEVQQQLLLSETRVELSKANYLPVVSGDLGYKRLYPVSSVSFPISTSEYKTFSFYTKDNYNASLSVNQPVIDLKTSANIEKAKANVKTASDNLKYNRAQVAYQVAQIYYSIIFLNKGIAVQQQQMDLLQANMEQTASKLENGDALQFDLVSTQVMYTNAENQYTELTSQLHKQYIALQLFTGIKNQPVEDSIINIQTFDFQVDSILAVSLTNNYDIKMAKDKMASGMWNLELAKRSRLPTLNLSGNIGYKNGYSPDLSTIRFNYFIGLGISIPIMSATRPGIQKQLAEMNLKANACQIDYQKAVISKDVANELENITKLSKLISGSDVQVQQAKLALDLANERYKNGVVTNLEFLTAQMNYQDALLNKLQFEYNLLLAKMELCRLSGDEWWN